MPLNNLEVKYVDIETIKPYKNNAKQHPKEQIEQIKKSIQEFGMIDPIGVWNNEIVEGHGRLIACQELGIKEVPIIRLNQLTDEQRRAYALIHNQLTLNSENDPEIEAEELEKILDIDMSDYGFDINLSEEEQEIVEDEIPDVPEEPKAKLGDIYQLGNHRLMCGDSTSEEDVAKLMNGEKADVVITDPPYGINIVKNNVGKIGGDKEITFKKGQVVGKLSGNHIAKARVYNRIINDETTDCAEKTYDIIKNISNNQIIFGGNYFTQFLPPKACWLIWDKDNGDSFLADGEMAWTSYDKGMKIYKWLWNGMSRQGSRDIELKERVHPTQKPVGLIANILKDFSDQENLILDVFGGSGSTLIACEQLNRKCYMMELDPHYVDVIIQRWENFTGQKAIKIN